MKKKLNYELRPADWLIIAMLDVVMHELNGSDIWFYSAIICFVLSITFTILDILIPR